MDELYYSSELSREEMDVMFDNLTRRWDILYHYWFPLYITNAQPVIAFDSDAFEKEFGFKKLRDILQEINQIIEIRELKYKGY